MTSSEKPTADMPRLSSQAGKHLIEAEHGPILGCPALWRLLGYRSADAFRKAVQRGTVPVETFAIPHRRGRFAKTEDVIRWIDSVIPARAHA